MLTNLLQILHVISKIWLPHKIIVGISDFFGFGPLKHYRLMTSAFSDSLMESGGGFSNIEAQNQTEFFLTYWPGM